MWDTTQYARFAAERARPFHDLLAQIDNDAPRSIIDLGCGTGRMTRLLADRWPQAEVIGVDSSQEMLADAREHAIDGRLQFLHADIADWNPDRPVDLLVSNAALQWLPDHAFLFPKLIHQIAPGGTLAVQMPTRFHTPSQTAHEARASDPRWRDQLADIGLHRESVKPIEWYVDLLHDLGCQVNAWSTHYVHVLTGKKPVLEWLKGTALRPLLARLDAAETEAFLQDLGERLDIAYPPKGDYTLFPFPRLFLVASRSGGASSD